MIVAIDGPSGSGKGTIAKLVGEKYNLTNIDTGATYRAIAYSVIKNDIDINEEDKIVQLAKNSNISFDINNNVFLDGIDISKEIRTQEVTSLVSKISLIVSLREYMVELQRKMAEGLDVIMEGRDITTVVFPDADYKFYLDASVEERAKRRYNQNKEKGIYVSYDEVLNSIKIRDHDDQHREVGALKRTNDQIYIDTTNLSIEDVINKISSYIEGGI